MEAYPSLIETERLKLREISSDDVAFILALLNEPAFIRNIGDRGVRTAADAAHWIETVARANYARLGFGHYTVVLRSTGEPIGICGFRTREGLAVPDLGYAILERHWSRGYASEAARAALDYACQSLRLERVAAICAPDNLASRVVLEKLGFGLRETTRLPGEDHDVLLYVIELAVPSV
jgi:RimJ/RimL family protein N-acetyltransferase